MSTSQPDHLKLLELAETAPARFQVIAAWRADWIMRARPNQLTPGGTDWMFWNIRAGRGWGKTRVGAEDLGYYCNVHPKSRGVVVSPTQDDCRAVCFEGDSGLCNVIPHPLIRRYNKQLLELELWNGSLIVGKSAEKPDRLRGPQYHRAWCDEIASWGGGKDVIRRADGSQVKSRLRETWDNLLFGLRLGTAPQCVITSTPRPLQFLRDLEANSLTRTTRGVTQDNVANLAASAVAMLEDTYGGTRLGRQELSGEILTDVEGALWKSSQLDMLRCKPGDEPAMLRVVVAIDPATTVNATSDETGIIVAGLGEDGHHYTLADLSGHYSPAEWARVAVAAYERFEADRIIGETNQGGDLIEANLRAHAEDSRFAYRGVHAKRGKYLRAEPIASITEKGRLHHVGSYPILEKQMTEWVGTTVDYSPDRLDAMVFAHLDLLTGASGHAFI